MKNNQNGRSMVEMLGVLAIIGVLSAGGLAGYSKAMFKHKLNNTMDQLTMLVTNIRTMYGTQDSYKDLSNVQAVSLGIVPAAMKGTAKAAVAPQGKEGEDGYVAGSAASQELVNPFKGTVTIEPSGATAKGDNRAFTVTYAGLPTEACIALVTADWGAGAGSGFIAVAAGSEKIEDALVGSGLGGRAEGAAYSVGNAINVCGSTTNTVALKFY
ncbi:MAG: hypothetical protein IJ870_04845 [Alphaproteobacteria bacterium]|nr:hypothetical protein [Alphaproteobacteria bacterium]